MPQADLTLEGLVHDLRNIFETIQDAADILESDPKHARLAATLNRSVQRGARMLSSFVEQTQAELDLDLIVLHAVEFARDFLTAVKGPQIEFIREIEPGLRIHSNPSSWERVFVNLFLNAAQAMGSDGTVTVRAGQEDGGIEIVVSDTGPGISPQNLERIFQPGFSTRARRSGLGLHIVRSVVESNKGAVAASNLPGGKGAQFRITLPQRSESEAESGLQAAGGV
jgi:signal transduction histidine kinase